jgi:Flp pilus assembly protein TadD
LAVALAEVDEKDPLAGIHFVKALELDRNYPEALSNYGVYLSRNNKLDEAEMILEQAVKLSPNYGTALNNLASVLIKREKLMDAEVVLLRALKLDDRSASVWNNLAAVYSKQGRMDEAVDTVWKARELDPGMHEAAANHIQILFMAKRLDQALSVIDGILELTPRAEAFRRRRAWILTEMGRHDDAIKEISGLKLDPTIESEMLLELGTRFLRVGSVWVARQYLSEAMHLTPANTRVLSNLAVSEVRTGHLDRAAELFESGIRHDPDSGIIRRNMAKLMVQQGRRTEALQMLEPLMSMTPVDTNTRLMYKAHPTSA